MMVALPKPQASTVSAIYEAYQAANQPRDGRSISVSTLAEPCSRKLFYSFRWASPVEEHDGRLLRLFETGNIEEERWIDNLRMIGCDVVDREPNPRTGREDQIMVEACNGHVRGYLDSEILGLPEAPKTWHVGEMKSHNAKSFADLKKKGVKESKPNHYGQIQTYMYHRGRERGIYLAVCKDTDELYAERLQLDADYVLRLLARAERIIDAHEPPSGVDDFTCRWCQHSAVCKDGAFARVNCRTCLYSSPEAGGSWSCSRWNKPLSAEEQAQGCPNHLYLPGLVPGEQIDASEADETVTYKLRNGETWTDGAEDEARQ